MKVYLYEEVYGEELYESIIMNIPDTNIWLSNTSYYNEDNYYEHIENLDFTDKFWDNLGKNDLLTYLGDL